MAEGAGCPQAGMIEAHWRWHTEGGCQGDNVPLSLGHKTQGQRGDGFPPLEVRLWGRMCVRIYLSIYRYL